MAAAPQIKVAKAAYISEIFVLPQLRPVAATSRELVRARKKASHVERSFESSISTAALLKQKFIKIEISPIFNEKLPFSEIWRMILRIRLFIILSVPKAISNTVPII